MFASLLASRATSLNAKAGAVAMAVAAFLTLLLSHFSAPLAPLRLLALAAAAFAAWSFCDEMGMRKPLNRAEFVFSAIALGAGGPRLCHLIEQMSMGLLRGMALVAQAHSLAGFRAVKPELPGRIQQFFRAPESG